MVPGGDSRLLAPEVVNEFYAARASDRGEVHYAMQASWELGNVMFELATGYEAWPHYPQAFAVNGVVTVLPESLRPWLPDTYPASVHDIIVGLMHADPMYRTPLSEAASMLDALRHEVWSGENDPKRRHPHDASATGQWITGRSVDGEVCQIPVDVSLPVVCLRDNVASRTALYRWVAPPSCAQVRPGDTCAHPDVQVVGVPHCGVRGEELGHVVAHG